MVSVSPDSWMQRCSSSSTRSFRSAFSCMREVKRCWSFSMAACKAWWTSTGTPPSGENNKKKGLFLSTNSKKKTNNKEKTKHQLFHFTPSKKNRTIFSPECSWSCSQWACWPGVWSCWLLWLWWCCCSSLMATAAWCLAATWSRCSSSSCLRASSRSASTWAKAPRINSSYGGLREEDE